MGSSGAGTGRIAVVGQPAPEQLGPDVTSFLRQLGNATWLRLPGRDRTRLRVVTTLLHGNEPSGVSALWRWLRSGETPAVDLGVFIGSVNAALHPPGFAHRTLPGLRDLNRCFLPPYSDASGETAQELLDLLAEQACEALVDIHDTTGHTPPYTVVKGVDPVRLGLSALFADRVVRLDLRLGTLLDAIEGRVPAITIECGRAGTAEAEAVALAGLRRFVTAERIASSDPAAELRVYGGAVQVRLKPGAAAAFAREPHPDVDLTLDLDLDLDRHNFELREPGTRLGWLAPGSHWLLEARAPDGTDVSRELFRARDGRLELACSRVPVMVTTQAAIARSDCLFYLVEEGG